MSDSSREPSLWLGTRRDESGEPVTLPTRALLRHAVALGSSGSGKTVFCKVVVEEAIRRGVPVIAIDPQGDLASLALGPAADAELAAQGGDVTVAAELRQRADVVVFTPASNKGVALSADPVDADAARLPPHERPQAITRSASRLAALLGYDLDSDEGAGVLAVLDRCMTELIDAGRPATSLSGLMDYLGNLGDGIERYARYLDPKKIRAAIRRAARLDVGARRMLFHDGIPIDIDVLLGRSGPGATPAGKTRVAVIYLNTLHAPEDKEFVVATIADRLYSWMLSHPSPELQALFFLDEVAPFIPPVKKPSCKEGLELLFKQARKFGIGCLIATQNPGDVDYRSLSQFGSWIIGRLATRQDLKKVEPALRSLAGANADDVIGALPALKPGELMVVSPDHFDAPCPLASRRLVTPHQTLDENVIERLARARWHERFPSSPSALRERPSIEHDATLPAWAVPIDRAHAGSGPVTAAVPDDRVAVPAGTDREAVHREHDLVVRGDREVDAASLASAPSTVAVKTGSPKRRNVPRAASTSTGGRATRANQRDASAPVDRVAQVLASKLSLTADEVARKARLSLPKAREALAQLIAADRAGTYRDGRAVKYWSRATGARPDLGMKARITAVRPIIDRATAESIGHTLARSKLLGLIGENETLDRARLEYRVVYRVMFEERVKKSLLARMVGSTHEQRLGSVYLHACDLSVLEYSKATGLRFATELPVHASEIEDLDGIASFDEVRPADIVFDEDEWRGRREPAEAKQCVRRLFGAKPGAVEPVMVPLWKLILRRGTGESFRVVWIDALAGHVVEWPDHARERSS